MSHDKKKNRRRNSGNRKSSSNDRKLTTNISTVSARTYNCPICGKKIRELSTAIAYGEKGEPAHFECIIKHIQKSESLSSNERICYLGSGCFGILEQRKNPESNTNFCIRKKIQYEELDSHSDWRTEMKDMMGSV